MKFFVGQKEGFFFFTYRQMKGMGASKCQNKNIQTLLTCLSSTYTFNTTCVYVYNLYDWFCYTSLLLLLLQRNSPKGDNRHENSHTPFDFGIVLNSKSWQNNKSLRPISRINWNMICQISTSAQLFPLLAKHYVCNIRVHNCANYNTWAHPNISHPFAPL